MVNIYPAKVFKSGNSVALRLPKALGLEEGVELQIIPDTEGRLLIRTPERAHAGLSELFGSFSDAFMAEGRADTPLHARDWDGPKADAA